MVACRVNLSRLNEEEESEEITVTASSVSDLQQRIEEEWFLRPKRYDLYVLGMTLEDDMFEEEADVDVNLVLKETERKMKAVFKTNKTRFLITGKRTRFEVIEMLHGRDIPVALKKKYGIFGSASFGLVTNKSESGKGNTKYTIEKYVLKGKKDGSLEIEATEEDKLMGGHDKVFWAVNEQRTELTPVNTKEYDEGEKITPKDYKKMVIDVVFGVAQTGFGVAEFAV